jgi:hypothetical protein
MIDRAKEFRTRIPFAKIVPDRRDDKGVNSVISSAARNLS